MTIDLTRRVIQVQLSRFISSIVFIILEVVLLFFLKFEVLGFLNNKVMATFVLVLFLAYKVIERFLDLNFIHYTDKGTAIVFRYFSMSYFSKQKSSIEINKAQFGGYEIAESLFGFKKVITLIHTVGTKSAKYKPVSISALNNEEYTKLIKSLDQIPVVEPTHEG